MTATPLTPLALAQPRAVAPQSALEPAGPAAAEIGRLWDVMLVVGTAVSMLVVVLLFVALLRERRRDELPPEADRLPDPRGERANIESGGRARPDRERPRSEALGARWMVAGGIVFPAVVLTALLLFTLRTLGSVSPRPNEPAPLVVAVIGKQWWWEVRYPHEQPSRIAITANELRIPVGRRVRVELESTDVIHSFWVPGLQGKTDMIPGRTNLTWLQADAPGRWRGQCAEFCGVQHAKMALVVVAEPQADFDAWLERQRAPAAPPADSAGRADEAAFLASGCVLCHAVRGTPARGELGPDLTHVGGRLTLAGGVLPNGVGHLAGWIADPQSIKPGSRMPAVPLTAAELHAIVRYLASLR
jgi:cytochrome c oxidase subunit II